MWTVVFQTLVVPVLLIVVPAIFNWIMWFPTSEHWAVFQLAHPRWATAIRVMRAVFPHLRKVKQVAQYLPPEAK